MKKKNVSIALAALTLASVGLTGCGGNKNPVANDENTVEVRVLSLGYGHQYAVELGEKFEAANPGVNVEIVPTRDGDSNGNIMVSGPKANTADLFLAFGGYWSKVEMGSSALPGYDFILEDLTDFLDETVYEDGTTLRERFLPGYLDWMSVDVEIDGEYQTREFAIPTASGLNGICYNIGLFEQYGWEIPNTTNELWALADDIVAEGYIAFSNTIRSTYLNYFAQTVMGQYMTAEEYYAYHHPTTEDDFYRYTTSVDGYGRLYALEESNKLQNPTWGRLTKYTIEDSYDQAQARLMTDEAVLCINGDWFDNEMRIVTAQAQEAGQYQKGTGFMRFPLTSAISDKLSYWNTLVNTEDRVPTYYDASIREFEYADALAAADELLSKCVDYAKSDRSGALPSIQFRGATYTATEGDIEIVDEAYRTTCANGPGHVATIPVYASAKENAKKFLAYMFSDEGAEIVAKNLNGAMLPIKTDYTKFAEYDSLSVFEQSTYEIIQSMIIVPNVGGLNDYKWHLPRAYAAEDFYAYKIDDKNYKTPYSIFQRDSLTKQAFLDKLYDAGLM